MKVSLFPVLLSLAYGSVFAQTANISKVSGESYVLGDFKQEELLVPYSNPGESKVHYLRKETLEKLLELFQAYQRENPDEKQKPFVVSAFRSFKDQKGIWEEKYTGKRRMRQPVKNKTPQEIISLILEFSSAPGTSRHHWGTDVDLNALENSYFEKGGKGEKFYLWMTKNAKRFGFCQPYSAKSLRSDKGYNEEKWHWSYAPIANRLQEDWVRLFKEGKIRWNGKVLGGEFLGELPLEFVTSVNQECKFIR
ncbi:M15 family metallopeptidase [Leptospira ellisii]|uniref:M15 family metallopeptidase n=1 Tax=Leptospira ellisii TaxID=2023197 RepID=A0A2N0BDM4_9LEPT|nr:M15 family metallopeptidase [Leptospira ellisii]MDV6234300.1 M15 family metallopeptidase [Leptospira ellisii]PJZ94634.1 peptidase M15 [Leptospira ellisii]PKA06253.1 peptidase M15 [Leptospira ellisii]